MHLLVFELSFVNFFSMKLISNESKVFRIEWIVFEL